jgi:hypothetical protein
VQKVYDNLDFSRGVEAFLTGMPAASVYAVCEGLSQAGVKRNGGIGITEDLMDARTLMLTRTPRPFTSSFASISKRGQWSSMCRLVFWGRLMTRFPDL